MTLPRYIELAMRSEWMLKRHLGLIENLEATEKAHAVDRFALVSELEVAEEAHRKKLEYWQPYLDAAVETEAQALKVDSLACDPPRNPGLVLSDLPRAIDDVKTATDRSVDRHGIFLEEERRTRAHYIAATIAILVVLVRVAAAETLLPRPLAHPSRLYVYLSDATTVFPLLFVIGGALVGMLLYGIVQLVIVDVDYLFGGPYIVFSLMVSLAYAFGVLHVRPGQMMLSVGWSVLWGTVTIPTLVFVLSYIPTYIILGRSDPMA